jgi:hypothetical protein
MSHIWRNEYPVLVTEAHTLGSIAIIRSLGRAGYPVHACSEHPNALGFYSRFAEASVVCPTYQDPAFCCWLRRYIQDHRIRAIIPSEGFLLAVRRSFSEFSPLLPYSSSESVVYAAMSKSDQMAAFTEGPLSEAASKHLPPFVLLQGAQNSVGARALNGLKPPLFIKVDGCHARDVEDSAVYSVSTVEQSQELLQRLSPRFNKVLVEGHVAGRGAGVFVLLWNGQPLAEFMHLRLHEVPHTGGVSSYRKSWWHQAMHDDALVKLKAMEWQGVAMMEYRWDSRTDDFHFVEMNGRFWGSLHLALFAGVDFPAMLLDAFHDHRPSPVLGARNESRCRYTFPRDFMYVWSRWKDKKLGWSAKFGSALEFLFLALNPKVHSDLWFPGDRMLYWRQLWRFFRELFQS